MTALIVDYGLCNLDSVQRAIQECGFEADVSADPARLAEADKIILPGVGNFSDAARLMKSTGWDAALKAHLAREKTPLLGICLGMQLLATSGFESAESQGLGLIPGKVVKLVPNAADERVPHVGWNELRFTQQSRLFDGIPEGKDFYFTHSFHFVPESKEDALAVTPYCAGFVSAVARGHVFGVQFHPEKSQTAGHQVLKNFLEM